MYKSIPDYIETLRKELGAGDPALIQDALSDAEEHLWTALAEAGTQRTEVDVEEALLRSVIESFGTPSEVAAAYLENEYRRQSMGSPSQPKGKGSLAMRMTAVLFDSQTWGAVLYSLLAGLTGCVYGLWVFFGLTLSLVSLIFILGIPLIGLFLLSLRGIALIEGKIVEALLGIRMPNRSLFVQQRLSWKDRFKALITESQTWRILLYLGLQFPLGLLSCFASLIVFAVSLKFILYPVWYWGFGRSLITFQPDLSLVPPVWSFPLVVLFGFLWLISALHGMRRLGRIQGQWAKKMLVVKAEV